MPEILVPGQLVGPPGADVTGLPTKPGAGPTLVGTQAANRYIDTFHDQHRLSSDPRFKQGRPWCGSRERAANRGYPDGFLGELQQGEYVATGPENALFTPTQTREDRLASFASAWDAPWMPKIKYFEFQWRAKRITIRYDRMKADYNLSRQRFYIAANKVAAQLGRQGVVYPQLPDMSVTAIVGEFDTREDPRIVDAAMSGDQWLLFGVGDVNVELARLLALWTDGMGFTAVPARAPEARPDVVEQIATAAPADLEAIIARAIEAHEARKKAENKAKADKLNAAKAAKKARTTAGAAM